MKIWSIRAFTEKQPLYPLFHSLLTWTKQNKTKIENSPHSWLLFPPYIPQMAALQGTAPYSGTFLSNRAQLRPSAPNPKPQIQMLQSHSACSAEPCWTFRLLLHAGLAAGCAEVKEILFLCSPGPEFHIWTLHARNFADELSDSCR